MINKKRLLKTFLDLVKIESVSLKEARVMRYIQKELQKIGIASSFDSAGKKIKGEVGNLFAYVKGTEKGSPIILNAHVDTVKTKKVYPCIKNEYILSDGTTILGADCKAGVAQILEVLRSLKEHRLAHPDLQLIFSVAEEIGLKGASAIRKNDLKADFALVLDGGELEEIILQAPTQENFEIEIIGKAAHAGIHPEEGISAISVASQAIAQLSLGRIDHETTANIGIISGGVATNIIPEKVYLKGEARSHSLVKLKKQIHRIESTFKKTCQKKGAQLIFKKQRIYPAFKISPQDRCVQKISQIMKKMGMVPIFKSTGGGSDANIFNHLKVKSVIIGTGMDRVHTHQERIKINDLSKGAEMLQNILGGLCG